MANRRCSMIFVARAAKAYLKLASEIVSAKTHSRRPNPAKGNKWLKKQKTWPWPGGAHWLDRRGSAVGSSNRNPQRKAGRISEGKSEIHAAASSEKPIWKI